MLIHEIFRSRMALVWCLFAFAANSSGAALRGKVEGVESSILPGSVESAVGAEAHLIAHRGDRGELIGSDGLRRSIDYSEVLYASHNLVRSKDGRLRFAGIDGGSNCRVFMLNGDAKPVRSAPLSNCGLMELFSTKGGLIAWVQEEDKTHRLAFLNEEGKELRKIRLPGANMIVTSVALAGGKLFAAMQSTNPDGEINVFGLDTASSSSNGKVLVQGTGALLAESSGLLILAVQRKDRRVLLGFDVALNKKWETTITLDKGLSTYGQLIAEGGHIYYVSGNNNKFFAASFDIEGRKLVEVIDEDAHRPLPVGGFAVSVVQGKLKAIGIATDGGKTSVLETFIVDGWK